MLWRRSVSIGGQTICSTVSELSLAGVKRAVSYPIDCPQPMENWKDCPPTTSRLRQIVDIIRQLRVECILFNYFRELRLIVKGHVPHEHTEWRICCPPRAAHSQSTDSLTKEISFLCSCFPAAAGYTSCFPLTYLLVRVTIVTQRLTLIRYYIRWWPIVSQRMTLAVYYRRFWSPKHSRAGPFLVV